MTWDYVFRHVDDVVRDSPESLDDRYVYGVEWTPDHFCVVVMSITGKMVDLRRTTTSEWDVRRNMLLKLNCLWPSDPVWFAAYGIAGSTIEALQVEGLPIISYSVTRATKERLIQNLALAIDQRRLTVLNSITLRDQLLNYRVELLSSGLYRYYALPEIGDDCVISLALAWHGINHGGTGISFV